jgi:hypothetical protein
MTPNSKLKKKRNQQVFSRRLQDGTSGKLKKFQRKKRKR